MHLLSLKLFGISIVAATALASSYGFAAEDVPPYLPGTAIGSFAGLLPPPGVYGTIALTHFNLKIYNGAGEDTRRRVGNNVFGLGVLWVPDVKVLGASLGVGITKPIREVGLRTPAFETEEFGTVNTALNVGTLSWNLSNGFFASAGLNVAIPDGTYTFGKPLNVGRNYYTFTPKFAVSYVKDGWGLSANGFIDFNTENPKNGYKTGASFDIELTAVKRIFGKFDFGIGSTYIHQFGDDTLRGLVVPAVPGGRSRGNRVDYISAGPVAIYDFGPFSLSITYQQNIRAINTLGGNQVFARINFPIWTDKPVSSRALESISR